jgi:hypothetical protein
MLGEGPGQAREVCTDMWILLTIDFNSQSSLSILRNCLLESYYSYIYIIMLS